MAKRFLTRLAVLLSLLALVATACDSSDDGDESVHPFQYAKFLTPLAEAQDASITPYWLGEEFPAGSLVFGITAAADLIPSVDAEPGFSFLYGAATEGGNSTLSLRTYMKRGGGAEELRSQTLAIEGATSEDVDVGPWQGQLVLIPGGTRPVNTAILFVTVDEVVVIGNAASGWSGVPGDDPNPLIEGELLIEVVAEHLRPYPE